MNAFITGALTGMAFGIVLYKVGASRYSRVMGMLTLRDTKVMKFAFTAIGVASLLYGLAAALGVGERFNLVPRIMPYMGLAHVLGGVLFGAGMGFSGLCPGTCVAKAGGQGGDKKGVMPAAIFGLLAGVLFYAWLKTPLTDAGIIAAQPLNLTLYGILGLPYASLALIWGALFILIAVVVDKTTHEQSYPLVRPRRSVLDYLRGEWSWTASGAIAGLLVVLATAQSGYLGFSGAVLAATGWLSHLVGMPMELVPKINDDIIWRAALIFGVFPGGVLARIFSLPSKAAAENPVPRTFEPKAMVRAFSAATVMSLGAMIGGGCTTGAFIAAWPTLSLGSLAMAGTFFIVSMAVGNGRLLWARSFDLTQAQNLGDRVYD